MLKARMRLVVASILAASSVTTVVGQEPARIQFDQESDFEFRVSDILPANVIEGPNYHLDPVVKIADGKFIFRIRTRWGILTAKGMPFLELRLREMYAVERAEKLSDQSQAIRGFLDTLVDTKSGAKLLLTDPADSLMRVPAGIRTSIAETLHPGNRRAGNDVRRKIAMQIACDPETTNPILKKLLDWMALKKGFGTFAGKLGLNLTLPGLSLLPATAEFRQTVAEQLPSDINKRISNQLLKMGMPKDTTRLFCRDHGFTTTQRLVILSHLEAMRDDIEQLDLLLKRAIDTRNESEGVGFIRELVLLQRLHKRQPVNSIVGGLGDQLLVVAMENRTHAVIAADDYLMLTERIVGFRQTYRADFATTTAFFFGDSRLNERVKTYFKRWGINVPEAQPAKASGG
ncbi:MAG: hypothetical protein O3A00_04250 [Planctomycetota bacterium]|nr:hypothetical protein [Planctomycetota bacterium]